MTEVPGASNINFYLIFSRTVTDDYSVVFQSPDGVTLSSERLYSFITALPFPPIFSQPKLPYGGIYYTTDFRCRYLNLTEMRKDI